MGAPRRVPARAKACCAAARADASPGRTGRVDGSCSCKESGGRARLAQAFLREGVRVAGAVEQFDAALNEPGDDPPKWKLFQLSARALRSSWIAVALASPSVVHAARGPSPLTLRLIVGHGAGVRGSSGRDALMLQELEDGSWMAGCRPDAWRLPGQAEGCQPRNHPAGHASAGRSGPGTPQTEPRRCVSGRRGVAGCGFPACPRPVPLSR